MSRVAANILMHDFDTHLDAFLLDRAFLDWIPNLCDSDAYVLATTPHHLPASPTDSPYIILNKDPPSLKRTSITGFSKNAR